ncbi:serine aminopeptidase domain-containing protein [Bradyrhizobium sp. LHD-71]|uniref:alpha/beta hydrolase family protein n=1 Tax=Bradyrhizobium sp. LHD-71 TaxID=3072141 RepID=UPI00280CA75C|nr:alpha/beta hydrolase [Bradyrhizobium sp. LHD-71]MDQ8729450.1 alpha/beta hydrolase [Bradyrhizobium sp. LHD-71]
MFRYLLVLLTFASVTLTQHARAMDDLLIDGVPLPADASIAVPVASPTDIQQRWSGVWVGAWGGSRKHILLVESVGADGAARVVYAIGAGPPGAQRGWSRPQALAAGRTLKVTGAGFSATYEMTEDGALKAEFKRGGSTSRAHMAKADLASLRNPDAVVAWTRGKSEFLQTDFVEHGKPVRLEVVIFKPSGAGPFPLAVINHGSTGGGRNPALFTETRVATDLADFLNERGWMVAFPQRRGRGKSDGLYDEGFAENRSLGYICADITLRGADRALSDIESAITALQRRQDVAPTPLLIGGISRGGILSVAYAGRHPAQVFGVINFVGGWLGDGCPVAGTVNQTLFERGAAYPRPTIWLYGRNDRFYSIPHSRDNFAAFEKAGGRGAFYEFDMPPGQGHFVAGHPDRWSDPIDRYLKSLGP